MSSPRLNAQLLVAPSKADVPTLLNDQLARLIVDCIHHHDCVTIALSGGSLASFLASLPDAFDRLHGINNDPHYDKWHIVLADERCVPFDHKDSNLGSLTQEFLSKVPIPPENIHGIVLHESTQKVAQDYEATLKQVLAKSGGILDLAVLGFGPDGHTCSLFPHHALLQERSTWVAGITDSPKPPPHRITLTIPVLTQHTRHVVMCGAGSSKAPIVQGVFASSTTNTLVDPPIYPCAMVGPTAFANSEWLWVVDQDALPESWKSSTKQS